MQKNIFVEQIFLEAMLKHMQVKDVIQDSAWLHQR